YLLNRSPTDSLKTTPYEMWEKKKSDLKNLQLFGCEAYAKVLEPIKKLDQRSKRYVFIGYAPTGYRLWSEEKQKIKIARDVKFGMRTHKKTKETHKRKWIDLLSEKETNSLAESSSEEEWEQANEEENTEEIEEDSEDITHHQEDNEMDVREVRRSTRDRKQIYGFRNAYVQRSYYRK
ncbi:Copia protein, partial [Ooceraea biroi]